MARRMDPGLGTSERLTAYRSQSVIIPPLRQIDEELSGAVATITCRSCRVRIPVDDIDSHECSPTAVKAANMSPSNRKLSDSGSSFLDSFLDGGSSSSSPASTNAAQTRYAEPTVVNVNQLDVPPTAPAVMTPDQYARTHFVDPSAVETPSQTSEVSQAPVKKRPPHLSSLGRSMSVPSSSPDNQNNPTSSLSASNLLTAAFSPRGRQTSAPESAALAPIQCRVRGVRVNKNRVAVYSIISSLPKKEQAPLSLTSGLIQTFGGSSGDNGSYAASSSSTASPRSNTPLTASGSSKITSTSNEIVVERRYREFYAFALNVYSMFPSQELWQRMPPKTYCATFAPGRRLNDGFLIRRKNGLDDFVRYAIEMMDLGSTAQGSLAQWYLVRLFLNISPLAMPKPTKDRSLSAARLELKSQWRKMEGWTPVGRVEEHDAMYEKVSDGFPMIKRVRLCRFPARAVFDMIVPRQDTGNSSPKRSGAHVNFNDADSMIGGARSDVDSAVIASWDPSVEYNEVLRRESGNTWVERTVFKGRLMTGNLQMVSLKTYKVEDNGSVVITIIPADDRDWDNLTTKSAQRVDCILGGWIITPTPNEETCTATWIMQANFGACDSRSEFTGNHGIRSFVARSTLLMWAEEINHLLARLESTYDPDHYRRLGPLLSDSAFQKVQIDQPTPTASTLEDPRVYTIACELEPCLCLLLHKSSNRNVLVFKVNLSTQSKGSIDDHNPLKAEWIMFEKSGNPRQDLSAIERNTTYNYSTKLMAPNVHRFTLELLRRDCVLRYDPMRGYALFTTINGKPNMLLKRVFLNYGKAPRIGFSRIEEATLVGESELEVIPMGASK